MHIDWSYATLAQLVITLGTAVAYIIHSAAAEWYEACAAGGIAAAPAHRDGGTNLRARHLIVCHSLTFLAAVRIRACKLDGIALADEPRHALEFPHLFLADVVRVLHHVFVIVWLANLVWLWLHSLAGHGCHSTAASHVRRFSYPWRLRHLNNTSAIIGWWKLWGIVDWW